MKRFEKYTIPVVVSIALLMSGFSLYTTLFKPQATVTVALLDTQRILDRQKVKWLHEIREASGDAMTVKRIESEAQTFEKTLQEAVNATLESIPASHQPHLILEARSVYTGQNKAVIDLTPYVLTRLHLDDAAYVKAREALTQDVFRLKEPSS